MTRVMAEMYGKREGCSRGRGGSMHLFDAPRASTAATRSSAAACRSPSGWRWPTRCRSATRVTACFFGEGAVAEGEFHESMNLAALWRLPVLFLCENNLYAMGTALGAPSRETDLVRQGGELRHGGRAAWTAWTCWPCEAAARAAADAMRAGSGPVLPRSCAPTASARTRCSIPSCTATKAEVEQWKRRDPIALRSHGACCDAQGLLERRGRVERARGAVARRDRRPRSRSPRRDPGAGRGLDRRTSARAATVAAMTHHDLPRGGARARCARRCAAIRACS